MGMGTTHTATTGMDTEFILTGLMWLSSRTTATNPTLAVARTIHMASRQHLIRITAELLTNPNLAISGIADSPDAWKTSAMVARYSARLLAKRGGMAQIAD